MVDLLYEHTQELPPAHIPFFHLWLFAPLSVAFWIANVCQPRCCVELAVHLIDLPGRRYREDINALDFCDTRADTVRNPTPPGLGAGEEDVQSCDVGDRGLCSLSNDERLFRGKGDSAELLVSAGRDLMHGDLLGSLQESQWSRLCQ